MTEQIRFTKMHGCGNDYLYVNCMEHELSDPAGASIRMSPRHFSVGSDGIILICASDIADAKMRIFNADGSEGKMCGNGIRCVGKYLYDNGIVDKLHVDVETLSGIKKLELFPGSDGKIESVKVDMGKASLEPEALPVKWDGPMIKGTVTVQGKPYQLTAVSMGNPHAVCFVDEVKSLKLEEFGPDFEHLSIFPEQVNTEFVRVVDDHTLEMRVWERGSAETYACGTGACASVVAAAVNGYVARDTEVTVKLIGGDLKIMYCSDGTVFMTGSAEKVYDGVYDYEY